MSVPSITAVDESFGQRGPAQLPPAVNRPAARRRDEVRARQDLRNAVQEGLRPSRVVGNVVVKSAVGLYVVEVHVLGEGDIAQTRDLLGYRFHHLRHRKGDGVSA